LQSTYFIYLIKTYITLRMAFPHFIDPAIFIPELAFTVIAVVFCFLIYLKTRESYELTKYEGIRYFRGAFLFFGLSYVTRFLFSLMHVSTIAFDFIPPRGIFVHLFMLPMAYFSTIGIFYLVFSSIWKKFSRKSLLIIGHSSAALLSIASFITMSHLILLYLQSALLLFGAFISFIIFKKGKKVSKIKILYLLVSALWLINLWVIGRRRPYSLETEIFFQIISLIVFIVIYHRIAKWVQ